MPRRSHKKSRTGCRECKKRHIKCDENKPKCVNCVTADTSCSFHELISTSSAHSTPQTIPSQPASTRDQRGSLPATPSDGPGSGSSPAFDSNLNLDHLELLFHWTNETCQTLFEERERQYLYQTTVVREALKFPFLMHQILGLAALHVASDASPERAAQYYHRATELQSAAMTGFNMHQRHVTEDSAFALLVFSSFIGLHVLADHSRTDNMSHQDFLDHFLHTVRLMQGVHTLVVDDWWQKIRERADVGRFLDVKHIEPPYNSPQPVKDLKQLIQNPDHFGPETLVAYTRAIHHLDWYFALTEVPYRSWSTIHLLMAWPVRSSVSYLNLVEQRQPEALIILAYFALVLHYYRASWMVRDTGIKLLNAIEANLDSHWAKWLDWPKELIASTQEQDRDAEMTNSIVLDPLLEHNVT